MEIYIEQLGDQARAARQSFSALASAGVEEEQIQTLNAEREIQMNGYYKAVDELSHIMTECEAEVRRGQEPQIAAAAAAPANGDNNRQEVKAKPVPTLKPNTLHKGCTPVEFDNWRREFIAYFDASNFKNVTAPEQIAHLRSCVDTYLMTRIQDSITEATPAHAAEGVRSGLTLLRDEFKILHPIFSRQLQYFRSSQRQGQLFSDWAHHMRQLADQAELHNLDVDGIKTMRYLTGCTDSKLLERFLKLEEPTWKDLDREVILYEEGKRKLQAMSSDTTSSTAFVGSNKTRNQGHGRYGNGGGNRDKYGGGNKSYGGERGGDNKNASKNKFGNDNKMKTGSNNEKNEKINCQNCMQYHAIGVCPASTKSCGNCNAKGHFRKACRSTVSSGSKPPSKKPSPAAMSTSQVETQEKVTFHLDMDNRAQHPYVHLHVTGRTKNGKQHRYLACLMADTGTTHVMLSEAFMKKARLGYEKLETTTAANTANNTVLELQGKTYLNFQLGDEDSDHVAYIAKDLSVDGLLPKELLKNLRILPENFPEQIPKDPTKEVFTTSQTETSSSLGTCSSSTRSVTTTSTASSSSSSGTCSSKLQSTGHAKLDELVAKYADVFEEDITTIHTEPTKIFVDKEDPKYKPLNVKRTKAIPVHMASAADRELKRLLDSGVIAKVDSNEYTVWCSRGHFVPKKNGEARLVVDLVQLNKFVNRPTHPFPSPRDVLRQIKPTSRFFLKFDATSGYHQIPLDEESSYLTTFLLPSGRYRYLRLPMGLRSSSDAFCYLTDQILELITKIIDDGLLQGETEEEVLQQFEETLIKCRQNNLKLSLPKLEFGETVEFAGYKLSYGKIEPCDARLAAVRKFPTPTDVSSLRSFLGLANQLGHFVPDLAHQSEDLRQLLKKNVAFVWLPAHQDAFDRIKDTLCSDLVVQPFDRDLPTELHTDASRLHGLGYALLQRKADGTTCLIQCNSRSLSPAETRYATNELECACIAWAVKDANFYLYGTPTPFKIITDHRPLLGTFSKPLQDLDNPRLFRFRERLLPYRFDMEWIAGQKHAIADALSRYPVFDPPENDEDPDLPPSMFWVNKNVTDDSPITDPNFDQLISAAKADRDYMDMYDAIKNAKRAENLPPTHPGRVYKQYWNDLSTSGGLIIYNGGRILIPRSERDKTLKKLHAAHPGIVRMQSLARDLFFWNGMSNDIKQMVEQCEACQVHRPSLPAEPVINYLPADEPMHAISMDILQVNGVNFLIAVDRFSGYPLVGLLRKTDTAAVLEHLQGWAETYGYPATITTDGGPQFRSDFSEFCKNHGIRHEVSSPHNHQSNGLAESCCKTVGHLIRKLPSMSAQLIREKLYALRTTPNATGRIPAHEFFGRKLRVPGLPRLPPAKSLLPTDAPARSSTTLRPLEIGENVLIQSQHGRKRWTKRGTITKKHHTGRSYDVQTEDTTYRRNRRFLKPQEEHGNVPNEVDKKTTEFDYEKQPRRSKRLRAKADKNN